MADLRNTLISEVCEHGMWDCEVVTFDESNMVIPCLGGDMRQASLADLIEVLEGLGAEKVLSDDEPDEHGWVHLRVVRPGSYIVWRIEEEQ